MADIPKHPVPQDNERLTAVGERFKKEFGEFPSFYARAPGRVNLIGEHIDYCGYSVLPMAVEQDILVGASASPTQEITLVNLEDGKYSSYSCSADEYTIDKSSPQWFHYFLCGYKGIMEFIRSQGDPTPAHRGLRAVVSGSVPPAAGLSSSSALVCAAAMVTLRLQKVALYQTEIAKLCAESEQYIGTIGGGMDQAICFLAERGKAKHIFFNPVRAEDVSLPPGIAFVISNSLQEANKAAGSEFNTRVVECRLGCQILAKSKGLPWKTIRRFRDLQVLLGLDLSDILSLVKEVLHEEPYSKQEVCSLLGVSDEELLVTSLSDNTRHVESFKLYQRATHVFGEASRVSQFAEVCKRGGEGAVSELGHLMDESHTSCSTMYECSSPNLDDLVRICKDSGALGSRLTGAGWGGCAVSLVKKDEAADFVQKVKSRFYDPDPVRKVKVAQSLFSTEPSDGASFYV